MMKRVHGQAGRAVTTSERGGASSKLGAADLNLLVVLASLLRTRSTTRSARELGRTQSAVSHALSRLRRTFDDPLFLRVGATLAPTPRAEGLAAPLAELLGRAESLIAGAGATFDPATLAREFAIGGTDFFEMLVLPGLMARLSSEAPRVSLVMRAPGDEVERALLAREVDLAFGTRFRPGGGIVLEPVSEIDMVVLTRRGHPMLSGRRRDAGAGRTKKPRAMDLGAYLELPHILVAPRGGPGGSVDDALAKMGLARRVVLRVQHFVVAAMTCCDSDLVVTLPRAFAEAIATRLGLSVHEAPLALPPYTFYFAHAPSRASDPGLAWLRDVVRAEFRAAIERGARRARSR